MTPKEKAKDLVEKMRDEIPCHCDDWEQAKQCALIAVDEILNNFGSTAEGKHFYTAYSTLEYWTAVKQEIENL